MSFFHSPSSVSGTGLRIVLGFSALIISLATPSFGQQPQLLLGDTNVETRVDKIPGGSVRAFPVRAVATGQVNSFSVYLDISNQAPTVWVGMYTNRNGHPEVLMTKGIISKPVAGQWNSAALPPVAVTKGTTYWMALLGLNGAMRFRDHYGRCRSEVGRQGNLSTLPATWTTGFGWPTCALSAFGTGTGTGTTPSATISISPRTSSLQAGKQQQFSAVVSGLSNPQVTWTASGGVISSTGLYTAPSASGTYTISAKAVSSQNGSLTSVTSDLAVVTVTQPNPPPPPVVTGITISPTASSLLVGAQQQFLASVTGTTSTGVIWSASAGTITSTGKYTAPATAGTYTIKAVSSADPTKSASAIVVVSAPQQVSVSISPSNTSVAQAGQVQFTATVTGQTNKSVTWAVTRGSGTITQSGVYTAPRTAENDVVTATSQADSTKSATASVSIVPPHTVSLDWDASKSTTVTSYNLYRGTTSGGPYKLIGSKIKTTSYTDSTVQSGVAYFYVSTAVDASGVESFFSNEMQSIIPSP